MSEADVQSIASVSERDDKDLAFVAGDSTDGASHVDGHELL